jgi:regulatory protein
MPCISKIERQKKNSSRWSVFVDDCFFAGCSEAILAALGIREGSEVSDDELSKIRESLDTGSIRQKALNYLSHRNRSVAEMTKYLKRKEFGEDQIASTIVWLKERNYLNDAQFAENWVRMRLEIAPRGRQKLLLELYQKGIDRATASKAIDNNLPSASEAEVAYQTITQRKNRWQGLEWLEIEGKIYNFLSYRGFSGEAVIAAARRYRVEMKEEDSEP